MMRDVAARAQGRVALLERAELRAQMTQQRHPAHLAFLREIAQRDLHGVEQIALRHFDRAIHVEFAKGEFGISQQARLGALVPQLDRDARAGSVARLDPPSARGFDRQRSVCVRNCE